jgi:hypothetical protein
MNFKDKFKIGDIICSDHFRNGLCVVVERLNPKDNGAVWLATGQFDSANVTMVRVRANSR